jgi:hypothetical protein
MRGDRCGPVTKYPSRCSVVSSLACARAERESRRCRLRARPPAPKERSRSSGSGWFARSSSTRNPMTPPSSLSASTICLRPASPGCPCAATSRSALSTARSTRSFKTTQMYIREAEGVREGFGDVFPELSARLLTTSSRPRNRPNGSRRGGFFAERAGFEADDTGTMAHKRRSIRIGRRCRSVLGRARKCAIGGGLGRFGTIRCAARGRSRPSWNLHLPGR